MPRPRPLTPMTARTSFSFGLSAAPAACRAVSEATVAAELLRKLRRVSECMGEVSLQRRGEGRASHCYPIRAAAASGSGKTVECFCVNLPPHGASTGRHLALDQIISRQGAM